MGEQTIQGWRVRFAYGGRDWVRADSDDGEQFAELDVDTLSLSVDFVKYPVPQHRRVLLPIDVAMAMHEMAKGARR